MDTHILNPGESSPTQISQGTHIIITRGNAVLLLHAEQVKLHENGHYYIPRGLQWTLRNASHELNSMVFLSVSLL